MAILLQINGQGTIRQTDENYSYKIEAHVTKSFGNVMEFNGTMEYTKDSRKTTVYGTISNDKLCFVETRTNKSSEPVSLIHDITFYKGNNGLGMTMGIANKAITSEQPYPIAIESISMTKTENEQEMG